MTQVFEAHGGYSRWEGMSALSFEMDGERHLIDLTNRKIRIIGESRTIGYDGEVVWVSPDTAQTDGARFYHNLYFYFFAMPFVLGDPGIRYSPEGTRELLGKQYRGVKVAFDQGIGDSPDDNYILWVDPETNKMEWLMYTVTYGDDEPNTDYNLIRYASWETVVGLHLPTVLQWYEYANDSIGGVRGEALFSNIKIAADAPDPGLFAMPEGAQVAGE